MSVTHPTQRPARDAAANDVAPETTHALAVSSRKEPRSFLLVCLWGVSVLVAVEWILCIAAFSVNLKLNKRYFSYIDAGLRRPDDVDYPPFVVKGWDRDIDGPLILCLLPLGYDTFFLSMIFCWTYLDRLRRVLVLCVSVLGFPMWSACGSFNVLIVLSAREETWDPTFNSSYGAFAALQILLGVAWLLVLIAAARSIDKRNKNRWIAEGVRRQLVEEGQLQDLPAYRA